MRSPAKIVCNSVLTGLLLLTALPSAAVGQNTGPIPATLMNDLQGVWVSRYASDPAKIEVRGDEIYVTSLARGSNPDPIGRAFKMVRLDEVRLDSSGAPMYQIWGECQAFGGTRWMWFTNSPGCRVGVMLSGFGVDARGKPRQGLSLHILANTFVRAEFKDKGG